MCMQRDFLLLAAAAAAMAAMPQTTSAAEPASGEIHSAASIPDFSRVWNHPAFPWFEPPASGPGPITNELGPFPRPLANHFRSPVMQP